MSYYLSTSMIEQYEALYQKKLNAYDHQDVGDRWRNFEILWGALDSDHKEKYVELAKSHKIKSEAEVELFES